MHKILTTAAFLALLPSASSADPAVGLGLTFTFGGTDPEPGFALRLFSDDRQNRMAGTVGLDFLIRSLTFRPTVGASYMGDDRFFGIDFGLGGGFGSAGLNAGFSGGYVNTVGPPAPVAVGPAPAAAPVVTPPVTPPAPPLAPVERPPENSTFLEEENRDILIGGGSDFA